MESKQKRTALVTGGSSGIGRCTAVALSKAGYIVYEFSRRDVPVEGVRHMRVDVTDEASVQEAVGQILLERESIEILVNCAGFGISGAVEFTESEQAKAQFNVNFFGTVNVSRAVLTSMRRQHSGHIVNISSVAAVAHIPFQAFYSASKAAVASYSCALDNEVSPYGVRVTAVELGDMPVIIGERINPTGKSKFKQALKEHNLDYILKEGITQQDKGAHILDVNVGLPDIDEVVMMKEVVRELQSVTSLPLQIDTVDTEAMEQAMRIYNGKPMVNSVSGKQESTNAVFPLIQKYGGVVIGLTLDENGIPKTAKGRLEVAGKIIEEAKKYGIDKKDIVIDVLTMTISSEPNGAKTTLEALKMVRDTYGVRTALGVSNISFGLPSRPAINANFYTMAMQNGLTAGIFNPSSEDMMRSYHSYCALMNYDTNCENYIAHYGNQEPVKTAVPAGQQIDLKTAIEKGLKEDAYQTTVALVKTEAPLEIINTYLIPALDTVGKGFEKGTVFLPQLLMSADAAKSSFAVLKEELEKNGGEEKEKEKVVLATVKGDIHDIGKNIVKVLLENYSFEVIDLGKDVAPERIVETVLEKEVRLVGLSALMTTTVVSMEETIRQLREKAPDCKVMVGGAVLNQEYADMIGADFYGKDAMQSVYYAQKILTNHR